jgi:RAP1 GTPase activating protein 1
MQERTRSQMLEDIVANLANHAETGQIPKPYRRGSWRPIGHMRPSSPLLDSVRDQFEGKDDDLRAQSSTGRESLLRPGVVCCLLPFHHLLFLLLSLLRLTDYDQLAKDFTRVFLNIEPSILSNGHLFDVVFLVGQSKQKARFIGVRAILGVRSRVFQVCGLVKRRHGLQ